jgi:hypothetical protein
MAEKTTRTPRTGRKPLPEGQKVKLDRIAILLLPDEDRALILGLTTAERAEALLEAARKRVQS